MLFGSMTMTVLASTLLKLGGRNINFEGSMLSIIMSFVTSPVIIAGFAIYALAAVLWVYCLSQFDLSYVTFVSSIQYVLIVVVSIMVFHEDISLMKWIGCGIIMIGVFFWLKG
jgi:drug/metabolite transporter (DMT)-like permease